MSTANLLEEVEPLYTVINKEEILKNRQNLPTEDDLPSEDGVPMETPRHEKQMIKLKYSIVDYWKDSKKYYVGGNMFLYYDPDDLFKFRGPDFFLVLGAEYRERKSWVVWHENMQCPDLIIELLSDSTRHIDKKEKKDLYLHVFRTKEYFLYDPESHEFFGYRLKDNDYKLLKADQEKKIYSQVTGLYLIVKDNWLRWMTTEGCLLPTQLELAEQERVRAEQEKQRAEQEKQRAEQEKLRAEQEKQRAEQEKLRAEEAEKLLEIYRKQFGNLQDKTQ